MREYRGKMVNGGEWAFGSLIINGAFDYAIYDCNNHDCYDGVEVTPESVGQYIGIKDRSRTKIFKGDIAKVYGGYYGDDILEIGFKNGCYGRIYKGKLLTFVSDHSENVEIIGNLTDNPELLKELEEKT